MRYAVAMSMVALALAGPAHAASPADGALAHYYTLKAVKDPGARAAISAAARKYPDHLAIQLESGYAALAVKDHGAARTAFRNATRIAPQRADLWRQLGYIEIELKDLDAAIDAFVQANRIEPSDDAVVLQIAYLKDERGRAREAASRFRNVMASSDRGRAITACKAYSVLRGLPDKLLPDPWFAEVYTAPEYLSHDDVAVFPADARVGVVANENLNLEVYGSMRFNADTKSGATSSGSQIFYDNVLVLAGGVRMQPLADVPIAVFAEAGGAYDLIDRGRPRWREDFRGGLLYYDEWNTDLDCEAPVLYGVRPVADAYADVIYFSRYDNVISFSRVRPGVRVIETDASAIDLYGLGALSWDVDGVDSNHFVEIGIGAAFRLYDPFRVTFRLEGVHRFRKDDSNYSEMRALVEYAARF